MEAPGRCWILRGCTSWHTILEMAEDLQDRKTQEHVEVKEMEHNPREARCRLKVDCQGWNHYG